MKRLILFQLHRLMTSVLEGVMRLDEESNMSCLLLYESLPERG